MALDRTTRLKVLIMVFLALKTFDLVFKYGRTDFGTRLKVFNALFYLFCIIKTFDLVPKFIKLLI
jgi:hypothetical protein